MKFRQDRGPRRLTLRVGARRPTLPLCPHSTTDRPCSSDTGRRSVLARRSHAGRGNEHFAVLLHFRMSRPRLVPFAPRLLVLRTSYDDHPWRKPRWPRPFGRRFDAQVASRLDSNLLQYPRWRGESAGDAASPAPFSFFARANHGACFRHREILIRKAHGMRRRRRCSRYLACPIWHARSRAFPPSAVLGPCLSTGWRVLAGCFRLLRRVPAAPAAGTRRRREGDRPIYPT